jgi:hypothetical protein
MTPANYHISVEQGSTFELLLTWSNSDSSLVDLTGYQAKLHVVTDYVNKTSLWEFNSETGGSSGTSLVLGGAAGTIAISATDTAVNALNFPNGIYDLLVKAPNSTVVKILKGTLKVNRGVGW